MTLGTMAQIDGGNDLKEAICQRRVIRVQLESVFNSVTCQFKQSCEIIREFGSW